MTIRDDYKQWCQQTLGDSPSDDPDRTATLATAQLRELAAGREVDVIVHDHREVREHIVEAAKVISQYGDNCTVEHFQDFHEFPNGSMDDIITVIVQGETTSEECEVFADLVACLGAELG